MKIKCFKLSLTIFLFLFYCQVNWSQKISYQTDHIGSVDGLSGQLCNFLCQDLKGDIWITTANELNKFDGYNTQFFNSKNSGIGSSHIIDLTLDGNGYVWTSELKESIKHNLKNIGPYYCTREIRITNTSTNKIILLEEYLPDAPFNAEDIVNMVAREDVIYFVLRSNEVYSFDKIIKKVFTIADEGTFLGIGNNDDYFSLIDNGYAIKRYTFNHEEIDIIPLDPNEILKWTGLGRNGHLFVQYVGANFEKLFLYKENLLTALPDYKLGPSFKTEWFLNSTMVEYIESTTSDRSYLLLDQQIHVDGNPIDFFTDNNYIPRYASDIHLDQFDNLYVATNLGVYIYKAYDQNFNTFLSNDSIKNSVRSLIFNDSLVLAHSGKENFFQSPNDTYDLSFLDGKIKDRAIIEYYIDPINPNHIWCSGHLGNVPILIDLKEQKFYKSKTSPLGLVRKIYRSPYTNILYAIGDKGIIENTIEVDDWVKSNLYIDKPGDLHENMEYMVAWNNNLLIASESGLLRFDEHENSIELFWEDHHYNLSPLAFIHVDKQDSTILWLGTKFNGLTRLDTKLMTSENFDQAAGLSNNNVHSIFEDQSNRLWISTNQYLNCLHKDLETNYIYTESDGISDEEFNRNSYYFDTGSGNLFLGGLNGYTFFNPDKIIEKSSVQKEIKFNKIETLDNKGNYRKEFTDGDSDIELPLHEDDLAISFHLNTNEIFRSKENQFEYRIEKIDSTWKKISGNEFVLGRLPYGQHTINFIANRKSNSNKGQIKEVYLDVLKPFYKNNWIYFLCFLLIYFLIKYFIKSRTKRVLIENQKLENEVHQRTLELSESNETKNKLFAILAHDLRGPINSLSGLARKVEFLTRKNRLSELQGLAEQTENKIEILNESLENILNWALAEMGQIDLKIEKVFFVNVIEEILNLYRTQVISKRINLTLELEKNDHVYSDRRVLHIILRNIINNAVKFSSEKDEIKIVKSSQNNDYLTIKIVDSGLGLNPTETEFGHYNSLNNVKSSGLGLIIIKELTELLGIDFELVSNEFNGATAVLIIPYKSILDNS